MEKVKQVWEYPAIAEVVYGLVDKGVKEEKRHLMIGAGIVLGSREAYDKQEKLMGYQKNTELYRAEEAGMIAEKIKELAGAKVLPKGLEEAVEGIKENGDIGDRVYGYIKKKGLYTKENLKGIGKWTEKLICGPGVKREFKEFKEELKKLVKEGDLTTKQICDPEYPKRLIKLSEERPGEREKIRKKFNLLKECQTKIGDWMEKEDDNLIGYLKEYLRDHY